LSFSGDVNLAKLARAGHADPAVDEVEVVEAPEAAVEPVEAPAVEVLPVAKAKGRGRRARHPAGAAPAKPGTFIGDDPATPDVNEAWAES
jgi:hypothetical protein